MGSCDATPFFPLGTPKRRNLRAFRHGIPIWSRFFLRDWNNLFIPTFLRCFKRVVLQCYKCLETLLTTTSRSSKALHFVVPVMLVAPFTLIAHGSPL